MACGGGRVSAAASGSRGELELREPMRFPARLLRPKLAFSARLVHSLNSRAPSPIMGVLQRMLFAPE